MARAPHWKKVVGKDYNPCFPEQVIGRAAVRRCAGAPRLATRWGRVDGQGCPYSVVEAVSGAESILRGLYVLHQLPEWYRVVYDP